MAPEPADPVTAEFAVLARRADLDVPADLLPGVLHGYRGLRGKAALLRAAADPGSAAGVGWAP